MTIGQLIKKRLKELHLTQLELANRLGFSTATINGFANDLHVPRFDTACILAKALGLSMNELADAYWSNK